MACKTYQELIKDLKPYLQNESKEEIDKAIEMVRNMDISDRVDAYEDTKLWALDMLNEAGPKLGKTPVTITGIKETTNGYAIDYTYPGGGKQYTRNIGEYNPFTFTIDNNYMGSKEDLFRLFSDRDFMEAGKNGYEKLAIDGLNDPEKMLELAKELQELDDVKTSDWHNEKLTEGLEELVGPLKQFVPKIALHLNKKANQNGGWMETNGDKVDVYIGLGKGNKYMTALEAYVHEMYHAATKYAIDAKDARMGAVLRSIRDIREQFLKEVDDVTLAKYLQGDKNKANEILDYISDRSVGLHEFVAYARTNEAVMRALQDIKIEEKREEYPDLASKLIAKIRELFKRLTNMVDKTPRDTNGYTAMQQLVFQLAQANNKALEKKRIGIAGKLMEGFAGIESNIVEYMQNVERKAQLKPLPKRGDGLLGQAVYMSKVIALGFVDERAKRSAEAAFNLMGLEPEGTILTTLRDMSESDATQDTAERLGLISQNIDQYRDFQFKTTASAVKNAFTRDLTEDEMTALTSMVIDTDLGSIWYQKSLDMGALLSDDKALNEEIKKREHALKARVSTPDYYFYTNQARGLGHYMMTGKASIAQLLNAENIARKVNTAARQDKVEKSIVESIDKLTTLYAVRDASKKDKALIKELLLSERNGIEVLVAYQMAHNEKIKETLFNQPSDKYKMIKGYSKEIYSREIDTKVAPLQDESKMKRRGYKLIRELGQHEKDSNKTKMGMYVSTVQVRPNLHRVGMRYTDMGRRGTTIREKYAMTDSSNITLKAGADITNMKVVMTKEVNKMFQRGYTPDGDNFGIVPILDNTGNAADFRYIMNKEEKVNTLGMDRRAINVIGRMYASAYDKEASKTFNDQLMEFIEKDAAKNYNESRIGRNQKEYVKIGPSAKESEIRDLWQVLPDNIKKRHKEGFIVRRDLMHSLLGYRELSIADAPGFKGLPEATRHVLRVGEHIWKEIVKVAKIDIILRVPAVLLGNVTSNFMYSLMTGNNPAEIAKLQLEGVRELNDLIKKTNEVIALENKINAGLGKKGDERKLEAMKNDLNSSTAKDLIDEGFYMTIIEDAGLEEFSTSNRFTELVESKLQGYPEFVKNGVNLLYLNERTKLFKMMNSATQYSDFVARYAQYHLMTRKGVAKEEAIKTVRDAFINYNKPNSRMIEWMNQMGFIMFTKYFTRIQKVLKATGKKHPMKVLMAILGQEYLLGDVEDVYDQSIVTKDLSNLFYNPLDTLLRAITPSGAEAVSWAGSKVLG